MRVSDVPATGPSAASVEMAALRHLGAEASACQSLWRSQSSTSALVACARATLSGSGASNPNMRELVRQCALTRDQVGAPAAVVCTSVWLM
jgi:hypothetical protein